MKFWDYYPSVDLGSGRNLTVWNYDNITETRKQLDCCWSSNARKTRLKHNSFVFVLLFKIIENGFTIHTQIILNHPCEQRPISSLKSATSTRMQKSFSPRIFNVGIFNSTGGSHANPWKVLNIDSYHGINRLYTLHQLSVRLLAKASTEQFIFHFSYVKRSLLWRCLTSFIRCYGEGWGGFMSVLKTQTQLRPRPLVVSYVQTFCRIWERM